MQLVFGVAQLTESGRCIQWHGQGCPDDRGSSTGVVWGGPTVSLTSCLLCSPLICQLLYGVPTNFAFNLVYAVEFTNRKYDHDSSFYRCIRPCIGVSE